MKVSGGVVSYEDGTKKAEEYAPPRKVRVELRFDLDEGEDTDGVLAKVSALAQARVHALLTGDPGKTKPPKAEVEAPAPAEPANKPAGRRPSKTEQGKPEPIQSKASLNDPEPPAQTAADAAVSIDEFVVEDAPKEVTDTELREAMTRKAAEIGGAVPIKALVGKYRPDGHTGQFASNQIPQAKRQAFLTDLKGLKAAA